MLDYDILINISLAVTRFGHAFKEGYFAAYVCADSLAERFAPGKALEYFHDLPRGYCRHCLIAYAHTALLRSHIFLRRTYGDVIQLSFIFNFRHIAVTCRFSFMLKTDLWCISAEATGGDFSASHAISLQVARFRHEFTDASSLRLLAGIRHRPISFLSFLESHELSLFTFSSRIIGYRHLWRRHFTRLAHFVLLILCSLFSIFFIIYTQPHTHFILILAIWVIIYALSYRRSIRV